MSPSSWHLYYRPPQKNWYGIELVCSVYFSPHLTLEEALDLIVRLRASEA